MQISDHETRNREEGGGGGAATTTDNARPVECALLVILHISTKLVIFLTCAMLFLNMLRFVTVWIKNKHIL